MKRMGWMFFVGVALAAGAEPALVDFERNWIFPRDLGGLKYESAEKYESADLGYRIFYRDGESFEATVSIFDLGRDSIPDGFNGEGIDTILQGVDGELQLRLRQEEIANLRKLSSSVVPKEGPLRFSSVVYGYEEADPPGEGKLQATYVTGIRGQFIELRFVFDRDEKMRAQKMAAGMLDQLARLATAPPPGADDLLMAACSVFLGDPGGYAGRTSAQYLVEKAQKMGSLNVYTHLFVWPNSSWAKPENAELLIAAYFAGMLQVVVPQHLDEGGEFEAFVAMLNAYEILRAKEQIGDIPKLDEWVQHPDKRALYDELLIVE